MRKYRLVAKKGEGTFSEVLKAQNVKDGKYHAIKCMKNRFESIDQVNNLREIQALRRLSPHEHVITLEEVLYDQPTGRLALVFELMDANLYELIRGRRHYLNPNLIKSNMWQLMKSLDHMHKKGIFHRDIKPENILIESTSEFGKGLKLADFGSCRGIYSKQPYTEYISTRWYRAPECLLTDGYYGPEMDLWGAGCVMFEITSLYPLFPGTNEVDQISRIHKVLGTPTPECLAKFKAKGASHISFDFPPQKAIGIPQLVPHASPDALDLMVKLLKYDASERITAREAMRHPYFKDIREAESKSSMDSKNTGLNATGGNSIAQSGIVTGSIEGGDPNSKLQNINNANPTLNNAKPLPSINGVAGANSETKNLASVASHQDLQYQQLQIKQQQAALKANSLPLTTGSNLVSSLPPIITPISTIANMNSSNNQVAKYIGGEQKSARGVQSQQQFQQQQSQLSNSQKRRKKYKTNLSQQQMQPIQQALQSQPNQHAASLNTQSKVGQQPSQNTDNVMKAYGIQKVLNSVENSSTSIQNNRHYVSGLKK